MNAEEQTNASRFLFVHVNEWATIDSPDTIPLSQGYALAGLRKQGYPGTILGDYKGSPLSPRLFRETLLNERPSVLGFSVYEENINRVRVWARYAKYILPEILVVLGGPQITFMPALALHHFSEADILCRGEAETVLPALGRALDRQRPLTEVPGITFWCQTRYNLIDGDLLSLLKKAGVHTIAFGLESADPDVLKKINKGLDPEKLSAVIAQVQGAGITVELFSLFGLPGESFAQAQKTLDYVKAGKVSIDGNSISQQLHLFFGIPMLDDPGSHGIVPTPITKPAYQSLCRDFATDSMTADEIEQMSIIWRLNREDFAENVATGTRLFEVAGFITSHFDAVACRPETDMMLSRIYLALEEYEAAHGCLTRLAEKFAGNLEVEKFLARPITCYKFKRRGVAAPGCRIIYDCKGIIDGRMEPETEAYFQDAVLGGGTLLADFDAGMQGMTAGRVNQFEVRFPADYGNKSLAGRLATFQVHLHQVMEPVAIAQWRDLLEQAPRNIYRFNDLDGLRRWNENLYYLALRESVPWKLTQEMTDFLGLINFYMRLGFRDKGDSLLELLPADGSMHEHAARILLASNRPDKTEELLSRIGNSGTEVTVNRAKALIKLKRYDDAEKVLSSPLLSRDIQILDLRVGLASLMRQPLEIYLARMDDLINRQVDSMEEQRHKIELN